MMTYWSVSLTDDIHSHTRWITLEIKQLPEITKTQKKPAQ